MKGEQMGESVGQTLDHLNDAPVFEDGMIDDVFRLLMDMPMSTEELERVTKELSGCPVSQQIFCDLQSMQMEAVEIRGMELLRHSEGKMLAEAAIPAADAVRVEAKLPKN